MKRTVLLALVATLLGTLVIAEDPFRPEAPAPPEVTPASAAAVSKGLAWLVSIQNRDGSWG